VRVSIIIPAFNEERLIGATLRHVQGASAAFARRGWATEWIVCDNNSTDRTAERARAAGATVVFEPVNQIARARNTGAAAANGDWLVFVDADSQPSVELFEEVADQICSGQCLAGGATICMERTSPGVTVVVGLWNALSRWKRLLAGSFIFCEAAAFRRLGGFSQELFAGEELELSARLHRLARATQRRIVILHRHPLRTSDRKVRLYTLREHLRFLARAVWDHHGTLRSREACSNWYDGRR